MAKLLEVFLVRPDHQVGDKVFDTVFDKYG